MSKVSIIIPCYNLGQYLDEAVDSVLAQTFQDFEIIIVNDGSTDDYTNKLLSNYNRAKTRVLTTENQGLPATRNYAIGLSQGKYICCLDADDYLHPEFLENTVKILDDDIRQEYGFVATWVQLFGDETYVWENFEYNPHRLAAENGIHVASLFRRKCWEEVGGYATNLSGYQDWDFWLSIVGKGYRWETIPRPLSYYRKRHDSMLKTSDLKSIEIFSQIIDNHLEYYQANFRSIIIEFKNIRERRIHDYQKAIQYLHSKELQLADNEALLREKELQITELSWQLGCVKDQVSELENQLLEQKEQLSTHKNQLAEQAQQLAMQHGLLNQRDIQLAEQERQLAELNQHLAYRERQVQEFLNSYCWKITAPIRHVADYLLPVVNNFKKHRHSVDAQEAPPLPVNAYHVKPLKPAQSNRQKVVHALANFMTGGSSRLVVDLVEHLGHIYDQEVLTSLCPTPPCYTGVQVHELTSQEQINDFFNEFQPDLVHVAYWGECDKAWYEMVFSIASTHGCKIIENVNTPVEPFFSDSIDSYVYVSNYVLQQFGRSDNKSMVIYPGSDFNIFSRQSPLDKIPDNCIGMVYRLETDKLNEQSIDVFIKVAALRPDVKVLIVGGGTYLETFKNAAAAHGVLDSFTFTGYVSYEELPKLYEQLSIFVAPVWKESFGQVAPFAMNMGIPVVGYDVGGLAEIVDDKSLLALPGDSDRLAVIINDLLDDRQKRLSIGESNRNRAQEMFSVDAMVDRYTGLYRKVLESPL